jgi:hypothetical protein
MAEAERPQQRDPDHGEDADDERVDDECPPEFHRVLLSLVARMTGLPLVGRIRVHADCQSGRTPIRPVDDRRA